MCVTVAVNPEKTRVSFAVVNAEDHAAPRTRGIVGGFLRGLEGRRYRTGRSEHGLSTGNRNRFEGATDDEIVLGMSAAFSGPSRGLGSELYRGAMAYFNYVNDNGGVAGRKITLKLYDDGYQPDPCVRNTMNLMLEDNVFLLFGYVGTPTVTRVLPLLKKFQDEQVYLFFPFTGAQPQREPPYGDFAFNLRASYRQETAGLVNNFLDAGKRKIGVFYQADAYGRSGWAGVRAALDRHGERLAGEATYRRASDSRAACGNRWKSSRQILQTPSSASGRTRLRGLRTRRRRPRPEGSNRQPFIRGKREHAPIAQRSGGGRGDLLTLSRQLPGGPEL